MFQPLSQMEAFNPIFEAFLSNAPVILPVFAIYAFEGPFLLKVWLAVQETPPPQAPTGTAEEKQSVRSDRNRWAIKHWLMVAIFAAIAWILLPRKKFFSLIYPIMILPYIIPWFDEYLARLTTTRVAIVRNIEGFPIILSVQHENAVHTNILKAIRILTGMAILTFAFFFDSKICTSLVLMVMMHAAAEVMYQKKQSLYDVLVVIGIVTVTAGIISLVAYMAYGSGRPSDPSLSGIMADLEEFRIGTIMFANWHTALIWSALAQMFITICYRFDYANATAINPLASSIPLETTPPLTYRGRSRGSGVFLPRSVGNHFSKPYYITALSAWCISTLATLTMKIFGLLTFEHMAEFHGLNSTIATLWIGTAVIALSSMRGEFTALWTYSDEWTVHEAAEESVREKLSLTASEEIQIKA